VVWSFVYLALCRLVQLVVLPCRSERSKELEILLLRHELAILRRQPRASAVSTPSIERFSAALARADPRVRTGGPTRRSRYTRRHMFSARLSSMRLP
jgi:hypothetical protein